MREESIGGFLDRLADRVPAPGGGASAALHAAQAGALLAMVARYSDGERYAEHAEAIREVLAEAERLRRQALNLAEQDAEAFSAVGEAYGLPKQTEQERAARSAAIQQALAGAAQPPASTVAVAQRLVELAEDLLPIGNRNVITDVAAAAEAARAAAATARVNVEINLAHLKDPMVRQRYEKAVSAVDELLARAEKITTAVREAIR